MEEIGAQVAHPIFMHQAIIPGQFYQAPPMSKKRDLSFRNTNFQQHPQQQQLQQQRFQNPNSNWDPNVWDWDSVNFVAKPSSEGEVLYRRTAATELRNKGEDSLKTVVAKKKDFIDEDRENLTLKLGGSLYSVNEPVARPNKRVRSGSPGGGGGGIGSGSGSGASYPMCQVDDCRGDLSNAKDYHRRHKVCELHSKTTKALVGKQMQRFCQQCSRFHPLSEFDEGKRSCRRRLAGHNRRRRKTQPEDVSSRLLLPGNQENSDSGNLEIVNLFKVIAGLQGSNPGRSTDAASIADRDRLIQNLSKIKAIPVAANTATGSPVPGGFDLNVPQEVSSEHSSKVNGNISAPSTTELLAILSAAVKASSPDALAILSQRSSHSDDDKAKLNCLDPVADVPLQKNSIPGFPSVGGEISTSTFQSTVEVSSCQVQESRPVLPLQLFGSSIESDSTPKLGSALKYFSSDSSNPVEERSPSSSPPVIQKLFPLWTASEGLKHESMSISGEDYGAVEVNTTPGGSSPSLELFKRPKGNVGNSSIQNPVCQPGYTSSSGSDHSPSTSNSDYQDQTGRIIFKLFDKDPSNLPRTIRTEILNWLSHIPSEIESYIRPGCVVLSIYIAMPSTSWEQLQRDLLQRVKFLLRDVNSDFWRNGRFFIHTDRRLASHKDGKIRLCKSWRAWSAPELTSVSPLAVVGGKQTTLVLRGRNLTVPGTKIHCAYMGGYVSKEVTGTSGTLYDDTSEESFNFPSEVPNILGRCFIEVENGFKGSSFPLIIADSTVCRELRLLEPELEVDAKTGDVIVEDQKQDIERPRSREDILHFLNELGWLFQRKNSSSRPDGPDFSLNRFRFLLTFSVERDWCALVKTLLDILVERNLEAGALSKDSLETLSEIHLLNRAVKRKCRNMVKLLIQFSLTCTTDASKKYLFSPSQMGPGGVTPLHLAASMHDSEEIVDALTDDPQQIGLSCWNSLSDATGQSPHAYALIRNNHNYNRLVARKTAEWKYGQVSIQVGDEISSLQPQNQQEQRLVGEEAERPNPKQLQLQSHRPCSRCAVVVTRRYMRIPGTHGMLHTPFVHSMLAIAAVCVCVCLFLRVYAVIGDVAPFKWENLGIGVS